MSSIRYSKMLTLSTHMSERIFIYILIFFISFPSTLVNCYSLLIRDDQQPGDVVFNASVYRLGSERNYHINSHRTADFVNSLLKVDPKNGQVSLQESLHCDGLFYPNLFTVYIDSTSNRLRDIDYYTLPLRIFIVGKECSVQNQEDEYYTDERVRRSVEKLHRQKRNPFLNDANEASVREGVSVGTTVLTLKATDQDVGKNAEVEYSIQSINGGGISTDEEDKRAFKIDFKSGVISTRTVLDRETTEIYTIVVEATDLATPQNARKSTSSTVNVKVLDDNDNYPQFSERTYTVTVNEDVNLIDSPVVTHIKATDMDQGNNAAIRYAIIGGNTQSQFAIDSITGDVSLVKPLDYETLRSYRLVIRAQDGGNPARSNTTQLLINVKDVNDNAPRFYTSLFQESVAESVPVGYSIVKVQAYDADEGPNADVKYTIAPRDSTGSSTEDFPLAVDPQTGWIYTTKELDREEHHKYRFQILANDQGVPPQSASASVIITVQDINDNNPVFEPKIYESIVAEDDPPGSPIATVTATYADEDGRLHYELTNGNVRGRFSITSHNGKGLITVAQPLDYKQEKRYVLTVTASDSGGRTDTATVYVNISDANNFSPVFEIAPYTASVFEDAPVGTTVLVVLASDNDVGINAQITYSLGEDMGNLDRQSEFSINSQTGAIITTKALDRETVNGYLLTVTARDGGNPCLSDTTDVIISITDVNDNFPIFKQPMYSGSVLEDALIGTSVVQVSATDADIGLNGRIRYTLSEKDLEDGSFVIDPTSGVIRTNKGLDRESVATYELEAYAIDRGSPSLSSSVPVNIRIEDINDSPPAL